MADCERMLDLLSAKIDGELSQAEEAELTAHLEHCESCRLLASELESIHAGMQSFSASPPEGLADGVIGKIKEENMSPQKIKAVSTPPRRRTWKILLSMAAAFLFIVAGVRFLPLFTGVNSGSSMSAGVPAPFPSENESQERIFGGESADENKLFESSTATGEAETKAGSSDPGKEGPVSRSAVSDEVDAGAMQSEAPESGSSENIAPENIAPENDQTSESDMTYQVAAGSLGEVFTAQNAAKALSAFLYPEEEINSAEINDEEGNFTSLAVTDQAGNSLCTLEYQGETEDYAAYRFLETKEGSEEESLWQVTVDGGEITEMTK